MIFRKSILLLTTIFFFSFFQSSYSNEIIIPKKKPAFKSQVVVPPLKPGTFNEKQSLKGDKDLPKEIFGILLPPKKPIIVKKITTPIQVDIDVAKGIIIKPTWSAYPYTTYN